MIQNSLTRLWFLRQGCRPVPPDFIDGKILWGHPDGYFLGALGQKLTHTYSPSDRAKQTKRGYHAPKMRHFGCKACHVLMALAFYGPRPIYIDKNGNPYVGEVHHLINDPLDYCPANLLCWLERPTHREADRRRQILEREIGDLHQLSYATLRYLQDPRITTREEFEKWIEEHTRLTPPSKVTTIPTVFFSDLKQAFHDQGGTLTYEQSKAACDLWTRLTNAQKRSLVYAVKAGSFFRPAIDRLVEEIKN